MAPPRPVAPWELILPAGWWLLAAEFVLLIAKALALGGARWPQGLIPLIRLAGRLSRAGFNSWRHHGGKWRWRNVKW